MKPSDFTKYPWSSILQKSECETIAQNIMIILKRTGNKFRKLTFAEYKNERLKDGNFTDSELHFFQQVISYCTSANKAKTFSKVWSHE